MMVFAAKEDQEEVKLDQSFKEKLLDINKKKGEDSRYD
jgi:hypothetical protein